MPLSRLFNPFHSTGLFLYTSGFLMDSGVKKDASVVKWFKKVTSFGSKYSRMDQVKFVKGSLKKIWIFHKFYLVHSWIPWPTFNDRECLQILENLEKHTILKSNRIQQLNSIATFWVRPLHHNQQQYKVHNMKIIWNAVFSRDFSGVMYFVLPRGLK